MLNSKEPRELDTCHLLFMLPRNKSQEGPGSAMFLLPPGSAAGFVYTTFLTVNSISVEEVLSECFLVTNVICHEY